MHTDISQGLEFSAGRWPLEPARKTLVLIHGAGCSQVLWQHQTDCLSQDMNTLAINLPGHGRSDGPGIASIEGYARSVSRFIQDMQLEQPFIGGLSMGGAIVLRLLIDEPDRYAGGIVANAGAKMKVSPMIFAAIQQDYQGFVNSMYSFGIAKKTAPACLKPLAEDMARCSPQVASDDFRACDSFNVMDQLHRIKAPTLVLTASDDQLTPAKYGNYLAEQIDKACLHCIQDAGHLAPVEKVEEVSRLIRDFVLKHG